MIVLFISYFIGLIISRIGSLVIEPLLSKMKFIKYAPYAEYLKAEQKDPKIKILLEKNNMYRTMISLLVSILLVKLYEYGTINIEIINKLEVIIIISILLVILLFSFRKQTKYIYKRIKLRDKKDDTD